MTYHSEECKSKFIAAQFVMAEFWKHCMCPPADREMDKTITVIAYLGN